MVFGGHFDWVGIAYIVNHNLPSRVQVADERAVCRYLSFFVGLPEPVRIIGVRALVMGYPDISDDKPVLVAWLKPDGRHDLGVGSRNSKRQK